MTAVRTRPCIRWRFAPLERHSVQPSRQLSAVIRPMAGSDRCITAAANFCEDVISQMEAVQRAREDDLHSDPVSAPISASCCQEKEMNAHVPSGVTTCARLLAGWNGGRCGMREAQNRSDLKVACNGRGLWPAIADDDDIYLKHMFLTCTKHIIINTFTMQIIVTF